MLPVNSRETVEAARLTAWRPLCTSRATAIEPERRTKSTSWTPSRQYPTEVSGLDAVLIKCAPTADSTRRPHRSDRSRVAASGRPLNADTRPVVMAITASEARKSLFPLIEQVNNDRIAVEITSKRGNAILMSREEYDALQETAYLLRSPANARRLLEGYAQAKAGQVEEHELDHRP